MARSLRRARARESKMVFSISHVGDEDDFMPPPDNKVNIKQLTKEEVGLIRAWIDQGAEVVSLPGAPDVSSA